MPKLPAFLHRLYHRLRPRLARVRPRRLLATGRWAGGVVAAVWRRRRERRLSVAVDVCAFWEPLTGIGWYLHQLLTALAQRDDLRLRLYGPWLVEGEGMPGPVVALPQGPALERVVYTTPEDLSLPPWRLGWLVQKLQKVLVAADGNRVLHAPNYLIPEHFRLARAARVATIHDLGFHQVPWALRQETLNELSTRLPETFATAHWLITVSVTVRQELLALGAGKVPPERIRAVQEGPGHLADASAELPAGLPAAFALHVGTLEPRKNLGTLLEAWQLLRREGGAPLALVLCGRLGWKSEALAERLAAGAREGWLHHLGYASNEQLAALYRQARMVLFPTWYEGFGLPALEAQRAGVPLVCSDIPVLHEVAGDGAVYLPPDQPAAWADEIRTLAADPERRAHLVRQGHDNVHRFSWQRCAEETLDVWRQAAGSRH